MPQCRVVELINAVIDPDSIIIEAQTPEKAAEIALGVSLTRSGALRNLRARVYSQRVGEPMNMVRLYGLVADQVPL